MAEIVERHMEGMIEEIEEMRRTKLLTIEETQVLLRKRRQFEYKVNGVIKDVQDFNDYIDFEKSLLYDLKVRREKLRIPYKKSSIEYKIIKRIKYLYEIAVQKFSDDFQLCLAYFKFCKDSSYNQAANLVVQKMTTTFSHIPEAWQIASAWQLKTDRKMALTILLKGIAFHKKCTMLYVQAIQLELLIRDKERVDDQEKQEAYDNLLCKKLEKYVESIIANVQDFKFIASVLESLTNISYTRSVQIFIIEQMLEHYSDDENLWHILAQRERQGYYYEPVEEPPSVLKFRLTRAFKKYREGLSIICEDRKPALWSLYFNFLINVKEQTQFTTLATQKLQQAFEEASQEIILEERYYIEWSKMTDDEETVVKIIEKGLKAIPTSVELWKLRLKSAILKDVIDEFNQVFKRSVLQLKDKALPMWILALRYHTLASDTRVIELIYLDAIKQPEPISSEMKTEYLQWIVLAKGIREARRAYNLLAKEKPYCKGLHMEMKKIETLEIVPNVGKIERIMKLACEQFGHDDIDLWIDLLQFYFKYRNSFMKKNPSFDLNEKVSQAYKEAENALNHTPLLVADLQRRYEAILSSDLSEAQ